MFAAYNDHASVAELLLRSGADKDAKDQQGATPLIMAASFGNLKVARLLLNAGADKEHKDKRDDSALEYALAANHDDMVALLDMDPDKRKRQGNSAALLRQKQRLLQAGAKPAGGAAKKRKLAAKAGKGKTVRV
jgi:ankyrin repeat protein